MTCGAEPFGVLASGNDQSGVICMEAQRHRTLISGHGKDLAAYIPEAAEEVLRKALDPQARRDTAYRISPDGSDAALRLWLIRPLTERHPGKYRSLYHGKET